MANPSEGNKRLESFLGLDVKYQTAIVLKHKEGKTHQYIADHLTNELKLETSIKTVDGWFSAGGKLEQASFDYTEYLGRAALVGARKDIKRLATTATAVLAQAMVNGETWDTKVRAAAHVLDRIIPKRMIASDDDPESDDDLPAELLEKGDAIVDGDNVPNSEENAAGAGDGSDESVPAPVLPEQSETNS